LIGFVQTRLPRRAGKSSGDATRPPTVAHEGAGSSGRSGAGAASPAASPRNSAGEVLDEVHLVDVACGVASRTASTAAP
jgi:hypothetical protein